MIITIIYRGVVVQLVRTVASATGHLMFYVYILKSLINGRLYTGSTNNLERRLVEHNTGQSKYSRLTRPFELMHFEKYLTRSAAVKREIFLKTGKGREELKNILENNPNNLQRGRSSVG